MPDLFVAFVIVEVPEKLKVIDLDTNAFDSVSQSICWSRKKRVMTMSLKAFFRKLFRQLVASDYLKHPSQKKKGSSGTLSF